MAERDPGGSGRHRDPTPSCLSALLPADLSPLFHTKPGFLLRCTVTTGGNLWLLRASLSHCQESKRVTARKRLPLCAVTAASAGHVLSGVRFAG